MELLGDKELEAEKADKQRVVVGCVTCHVVAWSFLESFLDLRACSKYVLSRGGGVDNTTDSTWTGFVPPDGGPFKNKLGV